MCFVNDAINMIEFSIHHHNNYSTTLCRVNLSRLECVDGIPRDLIGSINILVFTRRTLYKAFGVLEIY